MPIYEYYSPDTNRIYSFFAKSLAQGKLTPRCPDRPGARMVKIVSGFAIGGTRRESAPDAPSATPGEAPEDARMEAAMSAMEREFSSVDENDPRAMARMMRRMAELSGERLDGPMEEAVRKLEEGADLDTLEEQLGEEFGEGENGTEDGSPPGTAGQPGEPGAKPVDRPRFRLRRPPPTRDPKLHDYE